MMQEQFLDKLAPTLLLYAVAMGQTKQVKSKSLPPLHSDKKVVKGSFSVLF